MTNKELLELAARAAGVCLHPTEQLTHSYGNWGCDTTCSVCKEDPSESRWNPLVDDGDAFRLSIMLRIDIDYADNEVNASYLTNDGLYQIFYEFFLGGLDSAAVRLAIVRAAAEIGKAIP